MTESEFGKVIDFVEGAWGATMAGKQRDAYWLLLREADPAVVMANAIRLARSSRARYGVPKPGELLGADDEAPALLAWHSLVRAIEQHGHYDTVEFEDRVLSACVETLGGWMVVSAWPMADERELRFQQRDFERLYTALAARGAVGPEKHVGSFEAHNAGRFPEYVPALKLIPAATGEAKPLPPLSLPPGPGEDRSADVVSILRQKHESKP